MFQAQLIGRRIFSTELTCVSKSLLTILRIRPFCSSADVRSKSGITLNNAVDNHSNTPESPNSSSDSLKKSDDNTFNRTAISQNSTSQISSASIGYDNHSLNMSDSDDECIPLFKRKGNIRNHRLKKARDFMDNLSPELIEKKMKIEAIVDGLLETNALVPTNFDLIDWQHLLGRNPNYHSIAKCCRYLYHIEQANEHAEKQKVLEAQEREKNLSPKELQLFYFLPSLMREKCIKHWSRLRCLKSNIPLILDFNYPDSSDREKKATIRQLNEVLAVNYAHPQPCHLHMTSVMDNDSLKEFLEVTGDTLCGTVHEKPFWEVFPKDKLVYLTQDGPRLKSYTGDEIFIVGGLVEIGRSSPESYLKAKKLGIRCASLPFTDYTFFQHNKRLRLGHVVRIMLDYFLHHDWPRAFKSLTCDNSEEGWRDDKSEDSKVKKNMRYERYISDTRSGNKYQETRKFQRSKRQY
ncbi:tRNA methyltransferase 10 homolog C-like [Mya arenaria]|uniref:tRNA methyltransferase 10 homolog C-like n=1 Tax=Mya arenaria TaxID=6604 RepID=UPI0022E984AE|nr:tRNA methyltransferase 10 homolog C-like [Mya arenaria]